MGSAGLRVLDLLSEAADGHLEAVLFALLVECFVVCEEVLLLQVF